MSSSGVACCAAPWPPEWELQAAHGTAMWYVAALVSELPCCTVHGAARLSSSASMSFEMPAYVFECWLLRLQVAWHQPTACSAQQAPGAHHTGALEAVPVPPCSHKKAFKRASEAADAASQVACEIKQAEMPSRVSSCWGCRALGQWEGGVGRKVAGDTDTCWCHWHRLSW